MTSPIFSTRIFLIDIMMNYDENNEHNMYDHIQVFHVLNIYIMTFFHVKFTLLKRMQKIRTNLVSRSSLSLHFQKRE